MFMADLHTHTTYSDGSLSLGSLVDFYGQLGFGAIAITDHLCEKSGITGRAAYLAGRTLTKDTFSQYMEEINEEAYRAWRQYGLLVIPGYEITKNTLSHRRSCHLLVLGTSEYLAPEDSVENICQNAKSLGALTIAAHPTHTGRFEPQTYFLWDRRHLLADHIDAWEVASGPHYCEKVQASGLPVVASSDLHHPEQINSWKTVFDGSRSQQNVFDRIRQQDLSIIRYRKSAQGRSGFSPRRGVWGLPVQESL